MDAEATVFPVDKHARLAELGLREAWLLRAVSHGLMAWANCSENDPPTFPGFAAWAATVRTLREELAPEGWRSCDEGVSLAVNDDGNIAVLVAAGDNGTGDPTKRVSTKRSRGPKTSEQVQLNRGQLRLFPVTDPIVAVDLPDDRQVWMLLYRRDLFARKVWCELSLPISMGDDARPDEWRERIILASIPFDEDAIYPAADDDSFGPDIDIPVEKRA